MKAYCVKCKEKRELKEPKAVFTKSGTPATRGICAVCGTSLFRMGRTEAHDGMTPPKPAKPEKKRSGKLVIVESPAKARTVGNFLGKGYTVKASVGHVRDLLKSQISVDVENGFTPKYRVPNEKRPVVRELKKLADNAEEIYLATDPDREGEAIAWHLTEAAEIEPAYTYRVVFHEITKPAVTDAFSHARQINMDLVDAQQARRVLDRLVGYNLSPLLWRKVRSRLSAGRVQSVALRLIVEREREIEAFIPEEYWSIEVELKPETESNDRKSYIAKLVKIDGEDPVLDNEDKVKPILAELEKANYQISGIIRGQRQRKPSAPFITSTLQQEASRRLGFTARKTMAVAQQLYEGIDIGNGGEVGLITYMRTDSTNISELALDEVRQFIHSEYGENYLPKSARIYKTKAKGAQEAHEAIRPTSALRAPKSIKERMTRDQYRLYNLIWQRFIASQMANAIYDTIKVEVEGTTETHTYFLRASGSTIAFDGFLKVYADSKEEQKQENEQSIDFPESIAEGQSQELIRLIPEQHFTQPPPRYSEASLVRTLEENGIGRPSTYAPILSTIQQRGYVGKETNRLCPTETGILVNDLLVEHFPSILDVGFTAEMEQDLDRIATGDLPWVNVIREFYTPFSKQVEIAEKKMPEVKMEPESIGRICPKCGHDLVVRWGRFGKFISCSNFPECRYTEAWLEKINVRCPKDGGEIVERRTKRGRIFYGCSNYPECDFTSWKRPLSQPCSKCGGLLVVADKKNAQCTQCEERYSLEEITGDTEE